MDKFEALCSKVKPYLDMKFGDLPSTLRGEVGKVIAKKEWDLSSPQQRARRLLWHDLRRDPSTDRNTLAAHDTFANEAESLANGLIGAALARWNLEVERTVEIHRLLTKKNIHTKVDGRVVVTTDNGDLSGIQRAFRVWFWKWWREHDRTAPSRDDVYTRFGLPRGIARRPSVELLSLVRVDFRQKVGQKGVSKRGKRPIK